MAFAFITDAYDKVWKIALLGVDDALHMLPSYEEASAEPEVLQMLSVDD